MNWNAIGDALLALLQTVIIAVLPMITKYIKDYFAAKTEAIADMAVNENIASIVRTVGDLARQSVAYVSQTYVDNLKKEGKFDVEEQKIAAGKAFDRLKLMVDEESSAILESVFGDLTVYLETLIEAAVRDGNGFHGEAHVAHEPNDFN